MNNYADNLFLGFFKGLSELALIRTDEANCSVRWSPKNLQRVTIWCYLSLGYDAIHLHF